MAAPKAGASQCVMAVALSVVVGVVSGLYPAWRNSRLSPSQAFQA
jgi:putative ABC transport system permease protein